MDLHLHTLETTTINVVRTVVRIEIKDVALESYRGGARTTEPQTWREFLDCAELD